MCGTCGFDGEGACAGQKARSIVSFHDPGSREVNSVPSTGANVVRSNEILHGGLLDGHEVPLASQQERMTPHATLVRKLGDRLLTPCAQGLSLAMAPHKPLDGNLCGETVYA